MKNIRVCSFKYQENVKKLFPIIQDIDGSGILPPIIVVGNKCDLEQQRVVSQEEGEGLARGFGRSSAFMEASAKANIGIDNVSKKSVLALFMCRTLNFKSFG